MPQAFYTPLEDEEGGGFEAVEAGTQTTRGQGTEAPAASGLEEVEAKVVDMDGLGLKPEKKRDAEAVSAVGEADV